MDTLGPAISGSFVLLYLPHTLSTPLVYWASHVPRPSHPSVCHLQY